MRAGCLTEKCILARLFIDRHLIQKDDYFCLQFNVPLSWRAARRPSRVRFSSLRFVAAQFSQSSRAAEKVSRFPTIRIWFANHNKFYPWLQESQDLLIGLSQRSLMRRREQMGSGRVGHVSPLLVTERLEFCLEFFSVCSCFFQYFM